LLGDGRDSILGFIVFMCLVRDLLNDASIDTNMDAAHAELILKHILDKHEGAAEAVNTLYEEIAERINAEGQNRARTSRIKARNPRPIALARPMSLTPSCLGA